jgi:hypothetical protein
VTAPELYTAIMEAKGTISLSKDDALSYECPKRLARLVEALKPQLVAYLRSESVWDKRQMPMKCACRCAHRPSFPHHHAPVEQWVAVDAWGRDAAKPIEPTPYKEDAIWGLPPYPHDPVPEWRWANCATSEPAALPKTEDDVRALLPPGVRLAAFRPTRPPLLISRLSVVSNVPLFIGTTLEHLRAAREGRSWLAGNWSVRELMEVLEQVGVKVEVEP